ncbi:hypothetical protein [Brevibacillus reuszeri]|uniref:hypothetical protein n=1 Tax=Brevibacillus reuszeri TaxID=54915 RepID=UPI003D254C93
MDTYGAGTSVKQQFWQSVTDTFGYVVRKGKSHVDYPVPDRGKFSRSILHKLFTHLTSILSGRFLTRWSNMIGKKVLHPPVHQASRWHRSISGEQMATGPRYAGSI